MLVSTADWLCRPCRSSGMSSIEVTRCYDRDGPALGAGRFPCFLIPIAIGVTAHRDLRVNDLPALEIVVRARLVDPRSRYPFSSFLVLSPLAEAADRLVARIALEFRAGLIVPLPFARVEYEKDFELPESRAEFSRFLQQASRVLEIDLVPGATAENIAHAGPDRDRDRQYEAMALAALFRHL